MSNVSKEVVEESAIRSQCVANKRCCYINTVARAISRTDYNVATPVPINHVPRLLILEGKDFLCLINHSPSSAQASMYQYEAPVEGATYSEHVGDDTLKECSCVHESSV